MRLHAVLESADLPEGERRRVELLIEEAEFFALPGRLTSGTPDLHQFDLTIEREGARHEVRVDEGAAPETLRRLLRELVRIARAT